MMLRKYLQWCCELFARLFTMMLRILCLTLRPQQMFRQQIGLEQRALLSCTEKRSDFASACRRAPKWFAALMFSMSPIITPDWVSCRLTLTLHVHLGNWLPMQLLMSIPFISRGQVKYSPRCTYMYFISFAKALGPRFSGGQRYFKFSIFKIMICFDLFCSSAIMIFHFLRPPL